MDQERQMLRSTYKQRGSKAARSLLPNTLVGYYAQDYEAWRRSGSPDKP
jgi:hypothetical protein